MSQNITAIITSQPIHLPKEVVHFVEQGVTIIPLNIEGSPWQMEYFVNKASKFHRLGAFISFLATKNYWDFWLQDDDNPTRSNVLKDTIHLIQEHNLHTFFFEYYEEWADIPAGNSFMVIIDGEIITDSTIHKGGHELKLAYKKRIGLNHSWVANEDRYHSYKSAKREYDSLNSQPSK